MSLRTKNINLSPIKEMELRASKVPGVVSLAQGIPSFDTHELIKEGAIEKAKEGKVAKYSLSPGLLELREAIGNRLLEEGMEYDFETEIIITAGAIEAITASLLAVLEKGEEVIIPSPTYTSYQEAIKVAGGKPVFVDLDEEKRWAFSAEKLEQKISSKTKAILFCNPNNPTGTIYTKEQLLQIANLAEKHDLYLISDEVYKDFIYTKEKIFSLAQVPELKKRVIRVFSFSKAYAMTGWRVGYLHSDRKVVQEILKIHDSLITCAPVISQYAALVALELGEGIVKFYREEYLKRRGIICSWLDKLSSFFSYQVPNSSYFVFPRYKFSNQKSWEVAGELLEKAKIVAVPGVAFGPNGEFHLRFSFGRDEEDIHEFFQRLESYLLSHY